MPPGEGRTRGCPVQLAALPKELRVEGFEAVVVLAPHHVRQLVAQRLADFEVPPEALRAERRGLVELYNRSIYSSSGGRSCVAKGPASHG